MKVKDFIKELNNLNPEAELEFVISESFGDNYTCDNYGFNTVDLKTGKQTTNTEANLVELIATLDENFEINRS